MMAESIAQHQATLDVNAPRDFTDTMLIEILNTTDPASSFYGDFGIENLKNVMFDLFLAGSETTSTTLTWAALYMVRYPEVQKRVQVDKFLLNYGIIQQLRNPYLRHFILGTPPFPLHNFLADQWVVLRRLCNS